MRDAPLASFSRACSFSQSLSSVTPQSNADRVPSFLRYFVTNIDAVVAHDGIRVASQVLLLFMATRVLLGLAEGVHFPMMSQLTKTWFPLHERSRANGLWVAGIYLAVLSAPLALVPGTGTTRSNSEASTRSKIAVCEAPASIAQSGRSSVSSLYMWLRSASS